jgi:hypothetical protein
VIHLQNLAFADDIEALRQAGDELAGQLRTARLAREARGETRQRRPHLEQWDWNSGRPIECEYGR